MTGPRDREMSPLAFVPWPTPQPADRSAGRLSDDFIDARGVSVRSNGTAISSIYVWRRDSHGSRDSRDETDVSRHLVDAHVHGNALRQSHPGENGVNGRKPLLIRLCIRDVDSSGDAVDVPANHLAITHQLNCCRVTFANRSELGFLKIGVHPKGIRIHQREFALSNVGKVVALSQKIRDPSVNRGSNLCALEIDARLT